MRSLVLITLTLLVTACSEFIANNGNDNNCTVELKNDNIVYQCPDGSVKVIEPGEDGRDGRDGRDGVLLSRVTLPTGECHEVTPGVYIENINSGKLMDIYYNPHCSDSKGEYCDNVGTVYGSSGTMQNGIGAGGVCWVGNVQYSGVRNDDGSITVNILDFN